MSSAVVEDLLVLSLSFAIGFLVGTLRREYGMKDFLITLAVAAVLGLMVGAAIGFIMRELGK